MGEHENIKIVREYLSTSGTSDILIEYAFNGLPYLTVNAAYFSQGYLELRRYENVVITQRKTKPCGLFKQCIYMIITPIQKYTLLWSLYIYNIITSIKIL